MEHYVVKGDVLNRLLGKPVLGKTEYLDTVHWQKIKRTTKNSSLFYESVVDYAPDPLANHHMDAIMLALELKSWPKGK